MSSLWFQDSQPDSGDDPLFPYVLGIFITKMGRNRTRLDHTVRVLNPWDGTGGEDDWV